VDVEVVAEADWPSAAVPLNRKKRRPYRNHIFAWSDLQTACHRRVLQLKARAIILLATAVLQEVPARGVHFARHLD
jgi:hypothetical protein